MRQTNSIQASEKTEPGAVHRGGALPEISPHRRRRESGAMLLAVLFMVAMMAIVALAVAPAFVQQMKRDREEEMIHRGTEYARAVKKFYKKFGRYPASLEQLENTNQIRFLRRRFKDPLTKEGDWKLLHYGDIQALIGLAGFGVPVGPQALQGGAPGFSPPPPAGSAGSTGGDQGASTVPAGAQLSPQQQTAGTLPSADNGAAGQVGGVGGSQAGNTPGQTGSNNTIFGNTGVGGQTFGGGAIVGVASKDKDKTIRLFNKKTTYDEWVFIYSPAMDRVNILLRGPYNGQSYTGTGAQIGTPAGQLNQGNQSPFGQQPGGQTQHPGGFGQQNPQQNQQLTPGNQYPPDQSQPPQ